MGLFFDAEIMKLLNFFLQILIITSIAFAQNPLVNLRNGPIQGRVVTRQNNRQYLVYEGIPYARPPTGIYRFQPPQDPELWTQPRQATQFGASCPQTPYNPSTMSEDCLFLNVFAPMASLTGSPLPVMVFIHGGAYSVGSSTEYGEIGILDNLANRGVIVVTINYRLGVLGFWTTESVVNPGNYGIMDQIKAVAWVNQEIAKFGGDPNKVTIFGESAGAASVSILTRILPPGHWQQAIIQSASALSAWGIRKTSDSERFGFQLANMLNCGDGASGFQLNRAINSQNQTSTAADSQKIIENLAGQVVSAFQQNQGGDNTNQQSLNTLENLLKNLRIYSDKFLQNLQTNNWDAMKQSASELVSKTFNFDLGFQDDAGMKACLQAAPVDRLMQAQQQMAVSFLDIQWNPRVDGLLIKSPPDTFLTEENAGKPIMMGTTKDEYSYFEVQLKRLSNEQVTFNMTPNQARQAIITGTASSESETQNFEQVIRAMLYTYIDLPQAQLGAITSPNSVFYFNQTIQALSAEKFVIPVYKEAMHKSQAGAPVYLYSFDYVSQSTQAGDPWQGVSHIEELQYIFGALNDGNVPIRAWMTAGRNAAPTRADLEVQNAMGEMWTNFAKFGNPTPSSVLGQQWQKFDPVRTNYFSINWPQNQNRDNFHPIDVVYSTYVDSIQENICIAV